MNGGGTRIEAQSSTAYSTDESHDDSCCSSPLAFPIPVSFSITPRVSLPSHFRLGDATSCNTHESRSAAYAISSVLYLPTVILTVIWYSITHSLFHSRLKTFLLCKSFPLQSFLSSTYKNIYYVDSPGLFTVISEHICFLLLVFFSVFTLFSCRYRAVD